jgi:RecA/RadA recombinase
MQFIKNLETQFKPIAKNIETVNVGELSSIFGKSELPTGKFYEIFGESDIGKTTLCLNLIKILQKENTVLLVDSDCVFDRNYAKANEVNLQELCVINATTFRAYYNRYLPYAKIIIIDSIVTMNWNKKEWRTFVNNAHQSNAAVFITNQIRTDIRKHKTVGAKYRYITPDVDIQIKLFHKTQVKRGEKVLGHNVETAITRNRLFPTFALSNFFIPIRRNNDNNL